MRLFGLFFRSSKRLIGSLRGRMCCKISRCHSHILSGTCYSIFDFWLLSRLESCFLSFSGNLQSFRPCVRVCFSFLFFSCPWMHSFASWSLVCAEEKKGAFSSRIYIPISPAVSCSRGSKSDHVSCIEDIDIWSQVLDLRYFFLTAVFFLLPERMVLSDQDVRVKIICCVLCCSLVFVPENLNLLSVNLQRKKTIPFHIATLFLCRCGWVYFT